MHTICFPQILARGVTLPIEGYEYMNFNISFHLRNVLLYSSLLTMIRSFRTSKVDAIVNCVDVEDAQYNAGTKQNVRGEIASSSSTRQTKSS